MSRIALAVALSLVVGSAFATERATPNQSQECPGKLADLKKAVPKDIKVTTLTSGQVHVAQGLFLNAPPVAAGMPAIDGAVLLTQHGKKIAKILWVKGDRVCGGFDIPMPQVGFILSINPAPGEKIDSYDTEGDQSI